MTPEQRRAFLKGFSKKAGETWEEAERNYYHGQFREAEASPGFFRSLPFVQGFLRKFAEDRELRAAAERAKERAKERKEKTAARAALLNPNKDSDLVVERYVFSLNPSQFSSGVGLVWGKSNGWTAYKNPQVTFRAEEVSFNVRVPGLCYVSVIQAANVNAQIGGVSDASHSLKLALPVLAPQNTMQVSGTWGTVLDPAYVRAPQPRADEVLREREYGFTFRGRRFTIAKSHVRDLRTSVAHEEEQRFTLTIDFTGWAALIC